MTVEGGSNYRLEAELDGTTTLVITGAWSDAAAGLLEAGRADGLDLNYVRDSRTPIFHSFVTGRSSV